MIGVRGKGEGGPKQELPGLRKKLNSCTSCDLYKNATQGVPGAGRRKARLMLVGEQPGNEEDLNGQPFIGPAGVILDDALEAAGIEREEVYVTNAVKHFKWIARGKRRLHQKPNVLEINACRQWLEMEISAVRPSVIVCLGASAAYAVFKRRVVIKEEGGRLLEVPGMPGVVVTIHPSAVLRAPDANEKRDLFRQLVQDLKLSSQS